MKKSSRIHSLSSRREFLRRAGVGAVVANWSLGLPSLSHASGELPRKQRLVFIFSPNGVIPDHFWPKTLGRDFDLQRILEPLAPMKNQVVTIKGLCNQIKGDGDGHMRGMGCLLTGIELFPGDVQGGSDTPAGWSKGISVDQYLKNQLQTVPATQTRLGSIEMGVMVPKRADTWTRMCYAGPNQPVAPIDNPYQMFERLYGQTKNRELLSSVLDDLLEDFRKVEALISAEDRRLLQDHMAMVRQIEQDLQQERQHSQAAEVGHLVPSLPPNVRQENDNIPQICQMQMDLLLSSFVADFSRIASFQITNSVGEPRMRWLGIEEGHHSLSHEPDTNTEAYEKLIRINAWYCQQVAYLARRLAETPEPDGRGSLLDNTTLIWTNELGKGNSHTRNNIPFVLVGGGLGFRLGEAHAYKSTPHNRLLMSICEAMGHPVESFGNPDFCNDGVLTGLS